MGINKKLMTACLVIILAGCSSTIALKKGETWEQFGYDLAMGGSKMIETSRLESVDVAAYQKGYVSGLKAFCEQDGYDVGLSGVFYQGTCDELNPNFAEQYNIGWVDYEINQQNYDWELGTYEPSIDSYDY